MNKLILFTFFAAIILVFPLNAQAQAADEEVRVISAEEETKYFTTKEVAEHDNENDCYMIFGTKVYAITNFLKPHDKFLDIRPWCGKDMTPDFKDKAGRERDHYESTYTLLEKYYIGDIQQEEPIDESPAVSRYDFWTPFLVSLIAYLGWYFLTKTKLSEKTVLLSTPIFNFFWNTVMIVLLIPTVIFGFIMIFRYSIPYLNFIAFDWMYWHVELSVAFAVIVVLHLINRLQLYVAPLRLLGVRKEA